MFDFLTPRFVRTSSRLLPLLLLGALGCLAVGLYQALLVSPPDYQQGESVRMMYVHVPAAWMALGVYASMAISSISYLVWRNPLSDIIARESAPIGMVFAAITLATGMFWGKPIWGAWWVWDARLTSVLVLFFLYIGYMLVANAIESDERRAMVCALVALVGSINVPIIKFSVEWWNTLHQPASIIRSGGIAIHDSMLLPLLLMFTAFLLLYVSLLLLRVVSALAEKRALRKKSLQG